MYHLVTLALTITSREVTVFIFQNTRLFRLKTVLKMAKNVS
jgi:hypothetical protein